MKFIVTYIDTGNCDIATVEVEADSFAMAMLRAPNHLSTKQTNEVNQDTFKIMVEAVSR